MAHGIKVSEHLEIEEAIRRHSHWQYVVQNWLWQLPCVVRLSSEREERAERSDAPSAQALQEYGWLMEPHSLVSQ